MGKPTAAFCILHFADKEFVESQLSIGSNKIDLLSVLGPRVWHTRALNRCSWDKNKHDDSGRCGSGCFRHLCHRWLLYLHSYCGIMGECASGLVLFRFSDWANFVPIHWDHATVGTTEMPSVASRTVLANLKLIPAKIKNPTVRKFMNFLLFIYLFITRTFKAHFTHTESIKSAAENYIK